MAKKTKKTEEIVETVNPVLTEEGVITPEETLEIVKEIETGKSEEEIINDLETKVKEVLGPIEELEAEVDKLIKSNEEIDNIILSDPSVATEKLTNDLNKASELASEIKKEIKKVKPQTRTSITNWWNGMGYDF
jgi:protein-arginine kinase